MERMVCEMTENLSTIYRTIRIIPGIIISAMLEASSSGSCTTAPKLAKSLRISRRPFVGSFSLPLSLLRVSGNFTQIKLFKTPPFGCGTDKWRKVLPASIWPAGRWGFGSDLARLASRASLACVFFWGSLCRSLCTPDSNLRIDGQSNIVSRSVCVCVCLPFCEFVRSIVAPDIETLRTECYGITRPFGNLFFRKFLFPVAYLMPLLSAHPIRSLALISPFVVAFAENFPQESAQGG